MSECILSDWPKDRKGYGYSTLSGSKKNYFHHRLIYADACGYSYDELPEEVVRHTCDNPPCINIDHLIGGTIADNMQDKVDRERQARGESHGSSKLTVNDVLRIRANTELTRKELSEIYGVHQVTIGKILRREKWAHI